MRGVRVHHPQAEGVQAGRRQALTLQRARPGINADGTRTLVLTPPPGLALVNGQVVKVQTRPRSQAP